MPLPAWKHRGGDSRGVLFRANEDSSDDHEGTNVRAARRVGAFDLSREAAEVRRRIGYGPRLLSTDGEPCPDFRTQ